MKSLYCLYLVAIFICGIAFFSAGCDETRQEFSPLLHEDAVVVEAIHIPSRHKLQNSPQITDVEMPEKFAVVFKCKHGYLITDGKRIYENLKNHKGKIVDVSYSEIYRTTYDKKNENEQVLKRVLVGYDFIDATLK